MLFASVNYKKKKKKKKQGKADITVLKTKIRQKEFPITRQTNKQTVLDRDPVKSKGQFATVLCNLLFLCNTENTVCPNSSCE